MELTDREKMIIEFSRSKRGWFWNDDINNTIECKCAGVIRSWDTGDMVGFGTMDDTWYFNFTSKKPEPEIKIRDFVLTSCGSIKQTSNLEGGYYDKENKTWVLQEKTIRLPDKLQTDLKAFFKEREE